MAVAACNHEPDAATLLGTRLAHLCPHVSTQVRRGGAV